MRPLRGLQETRVATREDKDDLEEDLDHFLSHCPVPKRVHTLPQTPSPPSKPLWGHPHEEMTLISRALLSFIVRERSRLILLAGHLEKEQAVCEARPACPGLDPRASTRTASLFLSGSAGNGWWWVPVVGSLVGAMLRTATYQLLVAKHHPEDSEPSQDLECA